MNLKKFYVFYRSQTTNEPTRSEVFMAYSFGQAEEKAKEYADNEYISKIELDW